MKRALKARAIAGLWVVVTATIAVAATSNNVQTRSHSGFPSRPHGWSAITNQFGDPCNWEVNENVTTYYAVDVGQYYNVFFHRDLGLDSGSTLGANIWTHQKFGGHNGNILEGWWGYDCRYISGTTSWSLHALGIAIDGNSGPEVLAGAEVTGLVTADGAAARLFEIPGTATLIAAIDVEPTDDCPQYTVVADGLGHDEITVLVEGLELAG